MTELGQELQQTKPFASLEQEASLAILRTASMLADGLEGVLRPAGVSVAQYNVLRILRGADPEGLCRNDVRDRMISRMPDMTRMLDRMEAAGLVHRERDTADRRLVTTRITPRGLQLLEDVEAQVLEEHRRRLGHLGRDALRTLTRLLGAVRERT